MENWYGEYSVILHTEPTECIEEIFDAIRKLAALRKSMENAIDGTTEIIVRTGGRDLHYSGNEVEGGG